MENEVNSEAAPEADVSEDAALSEIYRSLAGDEEEGEAPADEPTEEAEDEPTEEAEDEAEDEQEEAEDEPKQEAKSAASYLPRAVREKWDSLPEDARDAIAGSYKELTDKLAQQGRAVKTAAPIIDRLEAVRREVPGVEHMSDEQLASGVYELAKTEAMISKDPLRGVLQIAGRFGVLDDLRGAFLAEAQKDGKGGGDAYAEIARLRQELAAAMDPSRYRDQFMSMVDERDTSALVSQFASKAEHWEAVEDAIPMYIQHLKAKMPDALPTDLLQRAYDMATRAEGLTTPAPAAAAPKADPRAEKAKKAASLSVKTTSSGRPKQVSEDEAMRAAYRAAVNS